MFSGAVLVCVKFGMRVSKFPKLLSYFVAIFQRNDLVLTFDVSACRHCSVIAYTWPFAGDLRPMHIYSCI